MLNTARTLIAALTCSVACLATPVQAQSTPAPATATAALGAAPSTAPSSEATPAAPAARPVAAGTGASAKVDNPYGIGALWTQSDAVAKGVLLILALMSMGSWYVIVSKLVEQRRMLSQARKAEQEFWDAGTVRAGADKLDSSSPFRFIADAGLDASKRHGGLHAKVDFADWVELSLHRATERVQRRLSNGMSLLATVGSTSPFVGLFGTVWGIYHALTAIGVAGQASIDKVAGPVGEALIMTAIGLAVAVPAVLGYNWLLRRNTAVMDEVRDFSGELHTVMLASSH